MKTISFNTGRIYSDKGQRIAAGRLDNGDVLMVDLDRGIEYLFPSDVYGDNQLNQSRVMHFYDYGHGEWHGRSYGNANIDELRLLAAEVEPIKGA